MTVSSGFFNSVNHDRLYDAEQVSSIFDGIIIDGVYENYGEAFSVKPYSDANSVVIIGTGRAWFDHTWTLNDSQFSLALDPPNEMLGRTDAIVIDVNRDQSVRKNSIVYVKGSESTPGNPPELINTELHKQYPICWITRPAGSNAPIKQSEITYLVGTSRCPMVTGILEAQNLENLMAQLDDEFNTWWDRIKEVLDENVATNLQNQIDEIKNKIDSDDALVGLLEKPIAEAFKNGNFGVNLKSYSFSFNPPMVEDDPSVDEARQTLIDYYPICGLLPDGYVFAIGRKTYGYGSTTKDSLVQLTCELVNTNGVATYHSIDLYGGDSGVSAYPYDYSNGILLYTHGSYDVFPVEINFVMYIGMANGDYRNRAWSYKVIITSQHEVSFQKIGEVGPVDESIMVYGSSQHHYTRNIIASESSNAYLFGYSTFSSRGAGVKPNDDDRATYGWTGKVLSNGVLTAPVRTDNVYPTDRNSSQLVYCEKDDNSYIAVLSGTNNDWVTIDKNTLIASVGSGTVSSDYTTLKTRFPVETYTLSESNGVQSTMYNVGDPQSTSESVKKSPYFVGGDNLGNGLIEGTYLCRNDSGRLYGIVSSGEQVAIGTNGGAAILKTKKTVSTSIDASKIQKTLPGQVDVPGVGRFNLQLSTLNSNLSSIAGSVICVLED